MAIPFSQWWTYMMLISLWGQCIYFASPFVPCFLYGLRYRFGGCLTRALKFAFPRAQTKKTYTSFNWCAAASMQSLPRSTRMQRPSWMLRGMFLVVFCNGFKAAFRMVLLVASHVSMWLRYSKSLAWDLATIECCWLSWCCFRWLGWP